ncbi:MAG: hypothetical protein R3C19_15990 [Planctomycetaceae bacterium]
MSVETSVPASPSAEQRGPARAPRRGQQVCPRCQSVESWGLSSWCPTCGYYPSVDKNAMKDTTWKERIVSEEEEEAARPSGFQAVPVWFWLLMTGVGVIIISGLIIHATWPSADGPRGTIALAELILGLVSFLIGHGIASYHAMKVDPRVNMADVLISWFNVWQNTIADLPASCPRVFGIIWGLCSMFTAVVVIGGIDYSAPFRVEGAPNRSPSASQVIGAVADTARAQADENLTMDESLRQLDDPDSMTAGAAALNRGMLQNPAEEDLGTKRFADKMHCVVYGLRTDSRNVPNALLFAGNTIGSDQHIATISADDMPRDDFFKIVTRLQSSTRKKPVVQSPINAVWVEPGVMCRLTYDSVAGNGELVNPQFGGVIVNQPGRHR